MNVLLSADEAAGRASDRRVEAEAPRPSGAILIYTAELLPYSETFVRDHASYLRRFRSILVGAKQVAGLSTEGLETAILPPSRLKRALLWFGGYSAELDRIVVDHDVVAIHAHFADAGARIARYSRRKGLPLLVTLHGADVLRRRSPSLLSGVIGLLWRDMKRSAALFLPVSDYLAGEAVRIGFPMERMRRHYLGIPVPESRSNKALEKDGETRVLFVGRAVEKKGLGHLLAAVQMLHARGVRVRLRIAGDGPELARHRAEAERSNLPVDFLGRLPSTAVQRELAEADIFCMPSMPARDGDNEGLGLVYLEAQASRVPVVAFDQGPVPEAVEAGVAGLLARAGSVEDLARQLEGLIVDPALRRRMGEAGRKNVEQRFDLEKQTRELEAIYDQTLALAGQPRI